MAEENLAPDEGAQEPVGDQEEPQLNDKEQVEKEAIERYQQSQKSKDEQENEVPEGYNADGTPVEDLIAGKFKSQEDLLNAYQELEKKLGAPKEEAPKEETPPLDSPEDTKGFSTSDYEKEVAENGKLSEDSYADLAKKGFTKQQVDQYIHGQTAYADSVKQSVYEKAGGEQKYSELMAWASDNMPEDVINDYNDAVNALDTNKVLRNLEYMAMKHQQTTPQQARRLEGDSPAEGMQPFADKNQWQKAQTNRLYGKDAKYTNMVDKRFLASRKRGIL
jgi:hypothetical protein